MTTDPIEPDETPLGEIIDGGVYAPDEFEEYDVHRFEPDDLEEYNQNEAMDYWNE